MKCFFCYSVLLLAATACRPHQPTDETMNVFTPIDSRAISDNVVHLMADEWMLITAGTPDHFNTMTASWGAVGHLWNRPVAFCFIRPQRYTFEFAEAQDCFTLSFFDETYRPALALCGRVSGRDVDKVKEAGLTPRILESGNVAFEEARLIIECRKIYADFFTPEQFIDDPSGIYPSGDFHKMYIGEIIHVWKGEKQGTEH